MVETKYQVIAGILMLLMTTAVGTYFIVSSGKDSSCKSGWELITIGDREGQYVCTASTPDRYQWCYAVKDSANTKNYWCEVGIVNYTDPVDLKVPDAEIPPLEVQQEVLQEAFYDNVSAISVDCNENKGTCVYSIIYKGDKLDYSMSVEESNSLVDSSRVDSYFKDYISDHYKSVSVGVVNATKLDETLNTMKSESKTNLNIATSINVVSKTIDAVPISDNLIIN